MVIVEVRVSILLFTLWRVKSEIYLYHTSDGFDIKSYDCVLVQSSLFYCRRPKEAVNLARNDEAVSCQGNGGVFHRFRELRSKNVSISTILHQWKSSLERVEEYSRYLSGASQPDGDLCQCLHPGQFGKDCEYRLPIGETFDETLEWQLIMRQKNPLDVQRYGDIVCYETLQCNSGVLCLDWREICDGIQNCMSGLDEENCDLLEMNRCNEDEYRCVNGMCIPDQFFLDGDRDCLDWSDEMQLKMSEECPLESANDECDDHICPLHRWSCGDGQCIEYRLGFQQWANIFCQSGREQYFICETHGIRRQWTMPNGRCFDASGDNGEYEELSAKNLSDAEQCQYLLKCSLSKDLEKGCSCDHDPGCVEKRKKVCPSLPIRYPRGAIATPFLFFLFNRTTNRSNKLPDALLINGTIRCRYSLITVIERVISFEQNMNLRQLIEDHFCQPSRQISWSPKTDQSRPECHQANDSTDRCGEWNRCLSVTRINDGSIDCINGRDEEKLTSMEIEKSCARVRRHRLHCSIEQATCLSLLSIADGSTDCQNLFDVSWFGTGRRELVSMNCNGSRKDECSLLRQYIDQSWTTVSMNKSDINSKRRIRFRSYCDSFWDLPGREDEDRLACQRWWICADDQHRCQTGQCIELRWFNDGEWDCQDASDEHMWLSEVTRSVLSRASAVDFTNKSYSIPSMCPSHSHPFLCLSSNARQPGFSCFNLSQIGDGHIDCAGAFDERNTMEHCSRSAMLGFNFRCPSSNTCIPFTHHCSNGFRCPNRSDDEHWCDREYYQPSDTSDLEAFTCLNGEHLPTPSFRCDGSPECLFWEDEYMCQYSESLRKTGSREEKQSFRSIKQSTFPFFAYPPDMNITQLISDSLSTIHGPRNISENVSSSSAYWCNRGVGVLSMANDSIACFCPPQYYGQKCEYHRDRLSVVLLLDLARSVDSWERESRLLLKLVVVFLVDAEVLGRDQFHLQPSFGSQTSKMIAHFLYPRSQRRERFFNRSDLLLRHPFSIRIELYQTRRDEQPSLIALWSYPILFDHLPVFRLAKVLQFGESSTDRNPCSSRPCHRNEQCQSLMNNKSQYICLCKTNFTGVNCSRKDPQCDLGYCAVGSLCQPSARGSIRGNFSLPFCLCPFNRYGDRCSIEHDRCLANPCLHGGSCFPDSQPDRVICLCTKEYSGAQCQWERPSIRLSLSGSVPHRGGVIQYLQIDLISLHLTLVDQQVFRTLPQHLEYFHSDLKTTLPDLVLVKLYSSGEDSIPGLYLLSVHLNLQLYSIRGRTEISSINRCDRLQTFSDVSSPIRYHQICIADEHRLCFRDEFYLCICQENHTRVECFSYDDQLDRCSHCRSHGRCLKGSPRRSNDFVCLCPACYSGEQCQFNTKSFSFTLDQLFSPELFSSQRQTTISLLILFSLFLFLLALPNNLFSFVTVRRRACLRFGIGHYLLWMSVVNQLNLLFFLIRVIHLIVKITETSSSPSVLDDILCKSFNYFLSCSIRLVYWLTSLIAIERVYMTIFINGQWLKSPRIARRLILFTFFVVIVTDLYELFFYKSFSNVTTGQGSICVLEISKNDRTLWMTFHLLFLLLHSLLPFLINLFSTIIIIAIIVNKKMKTIHSKTSDQIEKSDAMDIRLRLRLILDVLNENKEFVIGPAITLVPQLFSLPLFISSFIFDCQNLEESWLRHFLIVSYWISLTPQWTSFFLYIVPSSFYSNEWHRTNTRRWISRLLHRHSSAPTTKSTALSLTQNITKVKH